MGIRAGSIDGFEAVIALFDEAIAWLVEQGRPEQWGRVPFSQNEAMFAGVRATTEASDIFFAEVAGERVGC